VKAHPQLGFAWFNLGFLSLALDAPDQAVVSFEKSVQLGYRPRTSMYDLACAHALSGHATEALAWLDKALEIGFDNWSLLRSDSDIDSLRADPRFRRLLDLARAHERQASNP